MIYSRVQHLQIPKLNKHMRSRDGVKKLFYMSPAMSEILIAFEKRNTLEAVSCSKDNFYISTGSIILENQCIEFEKLFGVSLFNYYGVLKPMGLSLNSKNRLPALGSLERMYPYTLRLVILFFRLFTIELIFDGYIVNGVFDPMEAGIFDTCDFMQYEDTTSRDSLPKYALIDGQTLLNLLIFSVSPSKLSLLVGKVAS